MLQKDTEKSESGRTCIELTLLKNNFNWYTSGDEQRRDRGTYRVQLYLRTSVHRVAIQRFAVLRREKESNRALRKRAKGKNAWREENNAR